MALDYTNKVVELLPAGNLAAKVLHMDTHLFPGCVCQYFGQLSQLRSHYVHTPTKSNWPQVSVIHTLTSVPGI